MNAVHTFQLVKNMGLRYVVFRIIYEIKKRTGLLERAHPVNPRNMTFIRLSEWRKKNPEFLFNGRDSLTLEKRHSEVLSDHAKKILNGYTCFFSSEWLDLGSDYDWVTNPDTGYRYNPAQHWSKISDYSKKSGDIKFVWEKSRFTYLLTIIRFDYHYDEDNSKFVFDEISNWIDLNPVNQGPNWRCSQEISLRILNWCFALHFYRDSEWLDDQLWDKMQNSIYWQLHHVYNNINFSRIAVRNNHAITETLMLTLSELLFPYMPQTKKWASDGRKWFEQEIDYQIYEDGVFLQFSVNYYRVVIQLLSVGLSITEVHAKPFSKNVYDKAYKGLCFLYQCLQKENGRLPNTGSNDGALFFPLTSCSFTDFRPQLNTLHKILTGKPLYTNIDIAEDMHWVACKTKTEYKYKPLSIELGLHSFPHGGYYIIREENSFSFIRCGAYKDRPNQADNLHLDVWVNGINILRDQGSYKYNTDEETLSYFKGGQGHNTVSIENKDQMLKGNRFMWYYWVNKVSAKLREDRTDFIFEGEIEAYKYIKSGIVHKRRVTKSKGVNQWLVEDLIENKDDRELNIYWHVNPEAEKFVSIECHDNIGNALNPIIEDKWYSNYYGKKSTSRRYMFKSFSKGFKTKITITNENTINTSIF